MKKYKYIIALIFFVFLSPLYTKAATVLSASTQAPVVGTSLYVQINIDYGEDILISEAHYSISYDPTYLRLEEVFWTQSEGTYLQEEGIIYIDKDHTSSAWRYGGQVVMKFNVIDKGRTKIDIKETFPALYSDGNPVSQTMSGITISAVEPKDNTIIGSLSVSGYSLSPTFNKTHYDYKVTVPADVTEVEVVATKGDERQTIKGAGTRKLEYGDNRVQIMVNAEDGSAATYEIMITRTDNRTGDTSLKSLTVSNTNIVYQKEEDTYYSIVSKSVENILITAITNDPYATIIGTGTKELKIGQNEFELRVTTTGGNEKIYKIIITRSSHELQENIQSANLQTLTVERIVFDLTKEKVFLFEAPKEKNILDIKAITESKTASVEIIGNENLKTGFNSIEVKVKEVNGSENTYTIIAYKAPKTIISINDLNEITEKNKTLHYNSYEKNVHKLTKTQIKNITDNHNTLYYNVTNIYGGILYQIKIKDIEEDLNLSIEKTSKIPLTYEINIPKKQEITLYVGDTYNDSIAKIYTYNEEGNYTLLTEGATIENGYIKFTTNGDKYYCITYNSLIEKESKLSLIWKQYKLPFFILISTIFTIVLLINKRKKKQNNKEEPLY